MLSSHEGFSAFSRADLLSPLLSIILICFYIILGHAVKDKVENVDLFFVLPA